MQPFAPDTSAWKSAVNEQGMWLWWLQTIAGWSDSVTPQCFTEGLAGCFRLTPRTNRGMLVIPFHTLQRCESKYAGSDGGPSTLQLILSHLTR